MMKTKLENRVNDCRNLLDAANCDDDFHKKIITGDKTWVYGYDPETKRQSSHWIAKDSA